MAKIEDFEDESSDNEKEEEEEEILPVEGEEEEEGESSSGLSHVETWDVEEDVGERSFSPPLYRQRYVEVSSILEGSGPLKRVVDFGCAEGKFISIYLKKLKELEEIVGVDIDDFVLEGARNRTAPLLYEHLHPRKNPLDVYLMQGDVGTLDERLINVDAVSAIEIIEHLKQDTLENFKQVLFRSMKPRVAVITTPNVEYNVLFPNLSKFRHPEHLFEWKRSEFRTWCHGIINEFPEYSVTFSGVGFSVERPELGPCTQIATFRRTEDSSPNESSFIRDSEEHHHPNPAYKTLVHHSYPIDKDTRPFEEKLNAYLEYYINDCCRCRPAWENDEDDHLPLSFLSRFSLVAELTNDVEVIRKTLLDNSWDVIDMDGEYHVVVPPLMEEYAPSSFDEDDYNPDDYFDPNANRRVVMDDEDDLWD